MSSLSGLSKLFLGSAGSFEQAQPSHLLLLGTSGYRYRVWPSSIQMGRQLFPASDTHRALAHTGGVCNALHGPTPPKISDFSSNGTSSKKPSLTTSVK